MAGYIKGITIEFGADTSKLNSALKKTQGTINKTQAELKQINRSLKFNPGNTALLQQKFKLLGEAVDQTKGKLNQLRQMQANMKAAGIDQTSAQYRELEREIIKTENQLKRAEGELKAFGSVGKQQAIAVGRSFQAVGNKIKSAGRTITTAVSVYGVAGIYAGSRLIELSQKQAQAEQKLVEVYRSRMGATKGAAKETMNLASALQKQGVIGDEVALSFAQQMATYSSLPGTVNKLMPAFENLLVQQKGLNGTQEDATNLANMFGKAMMGQTGALKRAGISFTDAQAEVLKYGTEEEKAAMLAEVVTDNVGEMNAAFAKTDAGKIQQAKNALGDMGEEIGAVLLPAVADLVSWFQKNLMPRLQQFIDYMKQHPNIAKFTLAIAGITAVLGPVILIIGSFISAIGGLITIAPIVAGAFAAISAPVAAVVAGIAAAIAVGVALYKNWGTIKAKAALVWNNVKNAISVVVKAIKTNFNTLKKNVQLVWTAIFTKIKTVVTSIYKKVTTIFTTMRTKIAAIWNAVKTKISTVVNGIKTKVSTTFTSLKTKVSTTFTSLKTKVSTVWNGIKNAIVKPIQSAKNKVKGIINKIKGFFPLKAGKIFSGLKLPHFSVKGKAPFGIGGKGVKPGISVSWYKKAMQNPYMFSNATLFGAGESGDEVLYGRSALMRDIASAVGGAFGGNMGGTVINVYGSDNMSVNELASAVEHRIIQMQKRRSSAWA